MKMYTLFIQPSQDREPTLVGAFPNLTRTAVEASVSVANNILATGRRSRARADPEATRLTLWVELWDVDGPQTKTPRLR